MNEWYNMLIVIKLYYLQITTVALDSYLWQ